MRSTLDLQDVANLDGVVAPWKSRETFPCDLLGCRLTAADDPENACTEEADVDGNCCALSTLSSVSSVLPSMESSDRMVSLASLPARSLSCEELEPPLED